MGQNRTLIEEQISSRFLEGARTVRISLPAQYHSSKRTRYPVLYLHDGQNVFSSAGPDCCFGWGSWELDLIVAKLAAARRMEDVILVGIDHSRYRYTEYRGPSYPYKAAELRDLKRPPSAAGDDTRFEHYASFLIRELKPYLDANYRTKVPPGKTGLLGSSLGGICSLALAWQHPAVFGLAASMSGSFEIERAHFLRHIIERHKGKRKTIRIYLDSGAIDTGDDDDGRKITEELATALRKIGWKEGKNLMHFVEEHALTEAQMEEAGLRRDKWSEARESHHNEFYWRHRVWRPLTFMFPPPVDRKPAQI